jgi:rubrerythrin
MRDPDTPEALDLADHEEERADHARLLDEMQHPGPTTRVVVRCPVCRYTYTMTLIDTACPYCEDKNARMARRNPAGRQGHDYDQPGWTR